MRINNVNKVFLEVKKAGGELEEESHQKQLLNYSFEKGVKLAVLTNGFIWWFYLPSNEGTWEQRKFYSIDLLQQEIDDIASKFDDFLSKGNIENGNAYQNAEAAYKNKQKLNILQETIPKAWKKIITEPNERLIEIINDVTEGICGYKADDDMIKGFPNKHKEKLYILHRQENQSGKNIQQDSIIHKAKFKTRRDSLLQLIYELINDKGESVTREQICLKVPEYWDLEPDEKEIEKATKKPLYWHRVSSSLQQLKDKDKYLEGAGRGNWKITDKGYEYIRKKLLL